MTLFAAVNHPKVNAFDIFTDSKSSYGIGVYTYRKPGETDDQYIERDIKNFQKALDLKRKKKQ